MQQLIKSKPLYVVTDRSQKFLNENEALYLKNYRLTFNANANNDGNEGGNFGVGTPNRSDEKYTLLTLPAGINSTVANYTNVQTNEIYFGNWNSNGLHGWYRINGDTLKPEIIIIDPKLDFSIDPMHEIKPHRVFIRVVEYKAADGARAIKEQYLIYTQGIGSQKFINVEASIKTNGFDPETYPYWKLRGPHFDRNELIDLAVRPPMYAPVLTAIQPTVDDLNKSNQFINKSVKVGFKYIYTDGRSSTISPSSLPFSQKSSKCTTNNSGVPRCFDVAMYAGSAMVERIELYLKYCDGDWYLYDVIERFENQGQRRLDYWNRTGQWAKYGYDEATNTIHYTCCGNRQLGIVDQADINTYQNDVPLVSFSMTAPGDEIVFGNNLYGYNNIPKFELDKFDITVEDKIASSNSVSASRKITLYAYIAQLGKENNFVYFDGDDKKLRYGGIKYDTSNLPISNITYDKVESDYFNLNFGNVDGFVCYLAGTRYYAVSKQCKRLPDGTIEEIESLDISTPEGKASIISFINSGGYFIQKFEFSVPPGQYVARMAKQFANVDSNYETTSISIIGPANKNNISNFNGLPQWDATNGFNKEILIDACSADVDTWVTNDSLFYVFAPMVANHLIPNIEQNYRFIEGYLREDTTGDQAVERMGYFVKVGTDGSKRFGKYTDSNGYYFAFAAFNSADRTEVFFNGVVNCSYKNEAAQTRINSDGEPGYFQRFVYLKENNNNSYGVCNRIKIRGKVTDPITGTGYSGVGVTLTNGRSVFTTSDGSFELIAHDGVDTSRQEKIYINLGGGSGCLLVPQGGGCQITYDFNSQNTPCISCIERIYPTEYNVKATVSNETESSLKDGETYGLGAVAFDIAGRGTFVNVIDYFDVPTFMEKGNFNPSQVKVTLKSDLQLGADIKYFIFYLTKARKNQKYLQWVGDQIEYLDRNGTVVEDGTNAVQARVSIGSLLDYNAKSTFSTTATYQFQKGDVVRFYDNGDGALLTPDDGGLMDFPILGTYFNSGTGIDNNEPENALNPKFIYINYDKRLLKLKDACGFWLELQTPRDTSQVDTFGEIAGTYNVFNGVLKAGVFILNAFDTYYQTRSIHIKECTGTAITHPFSSSSVSDTFGTGCDSLGRLSTYNHNAEQRWYEDDTIRSDKFVNEGTINGLGKFRSANRKQIEGQARGGIVAMYAANKLIAVVCQNDYFWTDYNMNLVRVTSEGNVQANDQAGVGEPVQKAKDKYGCALEDVGTVTVDERNGLIFWIDTANSAGIIMEYGGASDIFDIDNKSYFSKKLNFIKNFNNNLSIGSRLLNLFEKNVGFDSKHGEFHVSFRPRKGLVNNPEYFTNTERGIRYDLPETFTFNTKQKKWTQFQTFVPEMYGMLPDSISGESMVAFMAGTPYFHNSQSVKTYNQFFGVTDTQIIEVVVGKSKDMTFQAVSLESTMGYFADRVLTNNDRLFSYIPFSKFRKSRNRYNASILRDMASYPDTYHKVISMLQDGGSKVSGDYCIIRLVRDLQKKIEYSEIDGIFIQYIGMEKSK